MVLQVEEPVYKIVTKDERTKEYKLLYDNEDKKKAKEYFESLIPAGEKLKTWQEIKNHEEEYTEIEFAQEYTQSFHEYSISKGYIKTEKLKEILKDKKGDN